MEKLRSIAEKAEDDLQIVNGEYEALNRELDLKDAEITSLERKLDGRGDDGTEMHKLREEIRDLQAQIEQYETEKQELERDARQLIEKDSRVARERNEERSNFQTVSLLFEYAYIRTLMNFKFSYVRRLRRRNELSHSTRRRYIHFLFITDISD